jgi:2-keto-4-pentenoate hydratase/2-oxohepta-3-ene-1,7-dioic acid hydratase in catechol pathway
MRFCRFIDTEGIRYGLVESVAGSDAITARLGGPHMEVNELGTPETILLPDLSKSEPLEKPIPLDSAKLLIPFPIVSKIVCMGRNYAEHAREGGHEPPPEPLIFLKPPTSLLSPGGKIKKPKISQRLDYEAELAIIIGRTCHKLQPDEDVHKYILGYTCLNDVSARDLQRKDGQWTRGKGFDTTCPVGPVIVTDLDTSHLKVQTRVNGAIKQDGNTKDFLFGIDVMMRFMAEVMTLLPGDIIATGTPAGIGPMVPGDMVEVYVEGIGTLRNWVIADHVSAGRVRGES